MPHKDGKAIMNQEVGNRVRTVREHVRRTQDDVAKSVGLGLLAYGTKERGHRPFFIHEIIKVAEVLGVEVNYLIYGGSRNPQQVLISEVSAILRDIEDKFEMVTKMLAEAEKKVVRDVPDWIDELSYDERQSVEKFLDYVQEKNRVGKFRDVDSLSV